MYAFKKAQLLSKSKIDLVFMDKKQGFHEAKLSFYEGEMPFHCIEMPFHL